jgi:hypothetical protein
MSCGRCGGIPAAIAVLDSRNGRSFRMFRCAGCDDISWREERR